MTEFSTPLTSEAAYTRGLRELVGTGVLVRVLERSEVWRSRKATRKISQLGYENLQSRTFTCVLFVCDVLVTLVCGFPNQPHALWRSQPQGQCIASLLLFALDGCDIERAGILVV